MKNMLKSVIEPPNGKELNLIKDVTVASAIAIEQKTSCFVLIGLLLGFLI